MPGGSDFQIPFELFNVLAGLFGRDLENLDIQTDRAIAVAFLQKPADVIHRGLGFGLTGFRGAVLAGHPHPVKNTQEGEKRNG